MASIPLPPGVLPPLPPPSAKPRRPNAPPGPVDVFSAVAMDVLPSGYSGTLVPGRAQALLALACQVGVDPDAVVNQGSSGSGMPLVSFLLSRLPRWTAPSDHDWPGTLEGFATLEPGPDRPVDGEWLVAVVLAAGANPWPDLAATGLNPADLPIHHALRGGYVGLVRRIMAAPGAPSIQDLAHSPLPALTDLPTDPSMTWLHQATSRRELAPVLEWMLAAGVRPDPARAPHPLEGATHQAVETYARHDALPQDAALCRKIQSAWRARTKSGNLDTTSLASMRARLSGVSVTPELEHASSILVDLSTPAWGKRPTQDWGQFSPNIGADALLARANVPTGPISGQWSGLAARLVHRLRQTAPSSKGIPEFSLGTMLKREHASGQWIMATGQTHPGVLAGAVGFDWRPGLPVDGIVALALLARECAQTEEASARISDDAALLGVDDPLAWASQHAPSAVAFTSALVSKVSSLASGAMLRAWTQALAVHPAYLDAHPEQKVHLLRAIHADFRHDHASRWGDLAAHLAPFSPWGSAPPPEMASLAPASRALALELALVSANPAWLDAVADAAAVWSPQDLERLRAWVDLAQSRPKPLPDATQARMRQVLLGVTLEDAARPPPRSRM